MSRSLRITLLESYYGGSHASFADTLVRMSRHDIDLVPLPARKWKWRMRAAAMWWCRDAGAWLARRPEAIMCTDMVSVADLRAMLPADARAIPIVCYFHENQLTYAIPETRRRDYQYGFTNITSCLAADAAWFNSDYHRETFLAAADGLLSRMPDHVPRDVARDIRRRSRVLYPPVDPGPPPTEARADGGGGALRIYWPHRWEYDKNPEALLKALMRCREAGLEFRLLLGGQRFRENPIAFDAIRRLGSRVSDVGYAPDRREYLQRIGRCDVVVSSAIEENFGIAVLEATMRGCQPLVPNRLAYPETIPPEYHAWCLYPDDAALPGALSDVIRGPRRLDEARRRALCRAQRDRFGAERAIRALDDALEEVVDRHRAGFRGVE